MLCLLLGEEDLEALVGDADLVGEKFAFG